MVTNIMLASKVPNTMIIQGFWSHNVGNRLGFYIMCGACSVKKAPSGGAPGASSHCTWTSCRFRILGLRV